MAFPILWLPQRVLHRALPVGPERELSLQGSHLLLRLVWPAPSHSYPRLRGQRRRQAHLDRHPLSEAMRPQVRR